MGAARAYALTLFQVSMRPNDTFRRLPTAGSIAPAFTFCAVALSAASGLSWVLDMATRGTPISAAGLAARLIPWLLIPVIASAVLHGLLKVARLGAGRWTLTFRVMCYVVGAWAPLMWIPYVGAVVGLTWTAYVTSVALHHTHGIDGLRTSVVTIMALPLIAAVALTVEYVVMLCLRGLA
jgi:hypothetical protein